VLAATYISDRVERGDTAAIRFERVDDGVGLRIDDRDCARPAIHRVNVSVARIDRERLHVGAGLQHGHRPSGALDDLHDAEIGKRDIGLAASRVDDHAFGPIGHTDLSVKRDNRGREDESCTKADAPSGECESAAARRRPTLSAEQRRGIRRRPAGR
jgi:hypothetical protein